MLLNCTKYLVITFLISFSAQAQVDWERLYGGDQNEFACRMIELSDSNILVCASTKSYGAGDSDIWLIKMTTDGDTLWQKTYGGEMYDSPSAINEFPDKTLLIAGITQSYGSDGTGASDVWILKLDEHGDTLWTKRFPGDSIAEVRTAVGNDGCIYLASNTDTQGTGSNDVRIDKLDDKGKRLWTKTFGLYDLENLNSLKYTPDGYLLLLMTSHSFGNKTMWVCKIDEEGETVWSKQYENFDCGNGSDILVLPDGYYMLGGYVAASGSSDVSDLVFIKIGSDGRIVWKKTYGDGSYNYSPIFTPLAGGNFFVTAIKKGAQPGKKIWLLRLNGEGDSLWSDIIGEDDTYNSADDFLETKDGKFLMLGSTKKYTDAADDLWLVALTPDIYVEMGEVVRYDLVKSQDSLDYTYRILTAPAGMSVSRGGKVHWQAPTSDIGSQAVEIAFSSQQSTDTVFFLVHLNKTTSISPFGSSTQTHKVVLNRPAADVRANSVRFTAPINSFEVHILTLRGLKVRTLNSRSNRSVTWNLRDDCGRKISSGSYVWRILYGSTSESRVFSVVH